MARLNWQIEQENRPPLRGGTDIVPGACRVRVPLPGGALRRVRAQMHVNMEAGDRAFFNGYQSWTWCPELRREDRLSGIGPLPKAVIAYFGLRRYGDYAFASYRNKPGFFHGESYCYFRRGESFRLIASLDERMGYTVFSYDAGSHILDIERDCAGLFWPGGDFPAFELFFAEGPEDAVFDAWFAAMGVRPRTREPLAGYTSWYNRYEAISEESICRDLVGSIGQLQEGDLFQIDDGWESAVGDWLEPDRRKFPGGMGAMADAIHKSGYRAGLWLAPFVARRSSALFRQHPDFFLQEKGRPLYCGCNWGGFYALDFDRREVRDYLVRVFERVFGDWGYDLVKLDFLYAAAPFGSREETRAGRMLRAMELLRELCGEKLILGCGVPLMPAFGLVDYCRIGCDVTLDWDDKPYRRGSVRERPSTRQSLENSVFRRQLNGRAWLNDPDVFYLREENLRLSGEQKRLLAAVNALFGGVLFHSDNMDDYGPAAREDYLRLRRLRDAERIRVEADSGLAVSYVLDGREQRLVIK